MLRICRKEDSFPPFQRWVLKMRESKDQLQIFSLCQSQAGNSDTLNLKIYPEAKVHPSTQRFYSKWNILRKTTYIKTHSVRHLPRLHQLLIHEQNAAEIHWLPVSVAYLSAETSTRRSVKGLRKHDPAGVMWLPEKSARDTLVCLHFPLQITPVAYHLKKSHHILSNNAFNSCHAQLNNLRMLVQKELHTLILCLLIYNFKIMTWISYIEHHISSLPPCLRTSPCR